MNLIALIVLIFIKFKFINSLTSLLVFLIVYNSYILFRGYIIEMGYQPALISIYATLIISLLLSAYFYIVAKFDR